jgi:dephospho-CoA kinase
MSVFAITGNLGSGKTTVLNLLKKKGAETFNCDERVHLYYKNKKSLVYKKVIALFPSVKENNRICCKKLSEIVFSSKEKLTQLEKIVHPVIIKDLKEWIRKAKENRIYVAEVPLLFEKNLSYLFKKVILVYVKREILIKRLRKKSNLSEREIKKRLSLYLPIREKIKKADFIINNSFSFSRLKKEVNNLWEWLKKENGYGKGKKQK